MKKKKAFRKIKNASVPIPGTKAKASAIPPKLTFPAKCPLATRTIIRAPMDNGWGPVSPYLEVLRSKPPSKAHSLTVSHPVSTLRDSLWPDIRQLLFFFTGFSCITLLVLYAVKGRFVNCFFVQKIASPCNYAIINVPKIHKGVDIPVGLEESGLNNTGCEEENYEL